MTGASALGGGRKRFRWLRWTLGACALLGAIPAATWLAAPWYVRSRVLPDLWARYGVTMMAERQDLSLADGAAQFHSVQLVHGEEAILTANVMEVRVSLRGLYEGRTILERVVFDRPVLHARLGSDGRTNLAKILEPKTHTQGTPSRPAARWKEVLVHDGTLEWDDPARGMRLRIVDVEVAVLDMQTGSGARQDRFGQITIDGNLEQQGTELAPLSIVHWTASSDTAEPSFVLHAALTGVDLDSFPGYVDPAQRASLGVDHLDLAVSMDVHEGIIRRGAAVAISPERKRPLTLLVGGPFADPVLDRTSRLMALWELPFSRLGRLGDVVWEPGEAVAGGMVSVIDGVVHGDLLGAGEAAAGGVGGGFLALGSNALDALEAIGRSFGLVAQEQVRDTASIHDHHRASFLSARREAAQAWSRVHSEMHDEAAAPDVAPRAPASAS